MKRLIRNNRILHEYAFLASANVFDEVFDNVENDPDLRQIVEQFLEIQPQLFLAFHNKAQQILKERGVTFRVYANDHTEDHTFPCDIFPRIISKREWQKIEDGLKQRVVALNCFLTDIYGEQKILKDKRVPEAMVLSSLGFNKKVIGITPPGGVYIHISGIDIIRDQNGDLVVLEDNLRVPSGVSYVLENRRLMKSLFAHILQGREVQEVDIYPEMLAEGIHSLRSDRMQAEECQSVLLTPGPYNSAYFEHQFLANQMNYKLVQGNDLVVENDYVYLRTDTILKKVDIIYRRVDDDYLDPEVFNPESLLGVPGLFRAYTKGNVVLANALGNGIADDKGMYPYVPAIIRYYLDEEPILDQVTTYLCGTPIDKNYVLDNMPSLVVKMVNQSGGYGMLIGPQATKAQIAEAKMRINANPRLYIAQPLVELSSCPTFDPQSATFFPRRVDLRPYVVLGKAGAWVLPGGLTRVALKPNSYVVNSSQGGGSKDTWVLNT